jgi:beta-galactosidase
MSQAPSVAAFPPDEKPTWGQEPVERLTPARSEIVLNGLWKFLPAVGDAERAPLGGWGSIWVPGDWKDNRGGRPGIAAQGSGTAWKDFNGDGLGKAWYERPIRVPADWAGRAVLLDLQRVSTDAEVFLDGVSCGKVEWPAGTVDLTKAVVPGKEQTLRILVAAAGDAKEALVLMGVNQISTTKADLDSRGIIGDVTLTSRPKGPHVSDVFVMPSTRKKLVTLDVEVVGARAGQPIQFTAEMLDGRGKVEKTFRGAGTLANGTRRLKLSFPWANPRLWDFAQPNLYTLRLQAKGAGVDDVYAQRFGFREFWIEGRRFMLNGKEFRMRPGLGGHQWADVHGNRELIEGNIEGLRRAGFNIEEFWPFDHDARGNVQYRELWATVADEKGWPVMGNALAIGNVIFTWRQPNWDQPGVKERWRQRMEAELRRYRNHPSILLWASSGNTFGHSDDQNPRRIGRTWNSPAFADTDEAWRKHQMRGQEAIQLVKAADPTRPVFYHQGTNGDVYALNNYLVFNPLQDREEWLSEWAIKGEMPYMAVEFGTPLDCSFFRGRNGFGGVMVSEPLLTEFSAIYLGNDAYRVETPEYRREIAAKFQKDQTYSSWHNNPVTNKAPNLHAIEDLFIRNTWRSWRTWGITGGMVPWSEAHGFQRKPAPSVDLGPFRPGRRGTYTRTVSPYYLKYWDPQTYEVQPGGQALLANNGPTLAWIAGKAGRFTEKSHNFRPGQPVEKQAVLINDQREPQPYTYQWTVTSNGKALASGQGRGTLREAQTAFFPIRFRTPEVGAGGKVDGQVRMTATVGSRSHQDTFAFRTFGPAPAAKGEVAVVDPEGKTTEVLRSLGYQPVAWTGSAVPLVVVGRNALVRDSAIVAKLESQARNGGRVLMMAQDPEWMRANLGLRIAHTVSRRVFPVDNGHPVVKGLDASDLRDWTGAGDLVEPKPDYTKPGTKLANGNPWWGWRWGTQGSVTSAAIEKPHLSGWRPILECEFDLAYSPLMELDYGKGRITLCTLDLEAQTAADPAAERLARQIVGHVASAPLQVRSTRTIYVGGMPGQELLRSMGVAFSSANALDPTADLVVFGADANPDAAQLEAFLSKGGKALFLARQREVAGVRFSEKKEFVGGGTLAGFPELAGISQSEVRTRTPVTAWVADGAETAANGQFARRAVGQGVAVFYQPDPQALEADTKTYLRFTRWRQTRALAQVLANLGATFEMDARIFRPEPDDANEVSLAGNWRAKATVLLPAGNQPGDTKDPGMTAEATAAVAAGFDDKAWPEIEAPGGFGPFNERDGEAVFRKVVDVPAHLAGKDLVMELGTVDDFDSTYFNGVKVGSVGIETTDFWNVRRQYTVPGNLVKSGLNVIAVRVFDHYGGGGFTGQGFMMKLRPKVAERKWRGFYHPDYRTDFELGDDPYRYYRW